MKVLQPANWKRPKGYSNGVAAKGDAVFIRNAQEEFTSADLTGQVRQALTNIVEVLSEANAKPSDIVRMTWYLIDKKEYLSAAKEIGAAYREIIGRHYPAMTVVQVSGLLEDKARVEIEVTALVAE
jgi:enamine deaminase RidA (YjgF/YER057c/UK114 family)